MYDGETKAVQMRYFRETICIELTRMNDKAEVSIKKVLTKLNYNNVGAALLPVRAAKLLS